ncbi:CPBP family intramembrane glutamic endopeptidase [Galbibacter sp.]|jgi:membrane protease YdiL (CAAX protease family)|uniref:CPBP family intramembrane glutamic endopeptidase n=1 Tax=Galbibacter sp. TaxID=2918471 RepID=UPI003A8F3228
MNNKNITRKILHFPLTKIIVGISIIVGLFALSKNLLGKIFQTNLLSNDLINLIVNIISSILTIVAYIYLYKYYEKRKITEFSTNGIAKNLSLGILLGAVAQSLTILVIYFAGEYSIVSVNPILYILPALGMAFSSAIFEEILLRGILFRIVEEKLGSYIALFISALIFGLLHLLNPNSSLIAGIGLAIQAGLLLGAAYIYSRNLWFPIAIHFAWNFTQTAIYGANVSGNALSKTLITSRISGSEWFTGGQFGPEGSIQATVFGLLASVFLLFLSHKKGNIVKPYWKTTITS